MNDAEFDAQLARAVKPIVTEVIPGSVARDATTFKGATTRVGTAGGVAIAALVLVLALAGATRLSGPGSAVTTPPVDANADAAARATAAISTSDGQVSVRRNSDNANLELVLQKGAAAPVVLASLSEKSPGANQSFVSVHLVDCQPSTGLTQRYYVFGQITTTGPIALDGVTGTGAAAHGRYVIAITSAVPDGRWTFHIGSNGGGALGSSLRDLPTYGQQSPSGCIVSL
jgi:hypothetical protein